MLRYKIKEQSKTSCDAHADCNRDDARMQDHMLHLLLTLGHAYYIHTPVHTCIHPTPQKVIAYGMSRGRNTFRMRLPFVVAASLLPLRLLPASCSLLSSLILIEMMRCARLEHIIAMLATCNILIQMIPISCPSSERTCRLEHIIAMLATCNISS